jgi:hypothetical protein
MSGQRFRRVITLHYPGGVDLRMWQVVGTTDRIAEVRGPRDPVLCRRSIVWLRFRGHVDIGDGLRPPPRRQYKR